MAEESQPESSSGKQQADETDELRTIGFRLREIQRLMAIRIEQENERLEAEGLDPVTEPQFRDTEKRAVESDEE